MKKLFVFVLTFITLSSFAQEIINDKNAEVRSVPGFNSIRVSGGIDLYLSQGNEEAIAVSASEIKFRDRIKTEVVNGVLKIYYDNEKFSISTSDKKLKAYVSFRDMKTLHASGASDVKISGTISVNTLKVHLSGASDLAGNVKINEMWIDASGASNVKLSGTVKSINIETSGASDVKGYELSVDECNAKASGASDIYLTVNKEISAHATGASSVYYKGDAVMKKVHRSGASAVEKKG